MKVSKIICQIRVAYTSNLRVVNYYVRDFGVMISIHDRYTSQHGKKYVMGFYGHSPWPGDGQPVSVVAV